MTRSRPPERPDDRPRRLRRLALGAFTAAATALLLVAALAFLALELEDAVLSYVEGESLWSKAQKEAVISLQDYLRTGDPAEWRRYREAIQVPLGDRQARRALQREPPDVAAARRGFLQGGLEPEEVDGMIRLFRWFHDWGPMARSVEHWTAGDSLIAELRGVAARVRAQRASPPPPDSAVLARTSRRLDELNAALSRRERQFTASIDRAADLLRRWSQWGVGGLTLLLLAGGAALARRVYRLLRDREASLRRSERRYRSIFESNVAAIYRSRPGGDVLDCNAAFAEMFGFDSPEEAVGTPGDEFFASPEERREANRRLAREGEVRNREFRLRRRDGEPIWVLANSVLLEDGTADGPVIYGTMIDITERKETRARYARLFEQSVAGVFRTGHEPPARILECNRAFARMFGFEDPGEAEGTSVLDLYPSAEAREEAMEDLRAAGRRYSEAAEMVRRDGTPIWIMGETRLVEDPALGAVHEGIVFDVTDRVRAREQLREREQRFRQMAEGVEEVFWLRSSGLEELLYVSPAFEAIWGRPVEHLYEQNDLWLEMVHPEDRERVAETVFGGSDRGFHEEYRIVRPDGEVRWIEDRGVPVEGEGPGAGRIAGVARDVTEQRRLEEQLRYRAVHDPLTDLANRTLLLDRVEQGLARARRTGATLGLLMLDVDHFKRVNDRLGHAAGDRVLTELARRLRAATREEDTVGRWGGDEFVIVLPEVGGVEGLELLRRRIREVVGRPIQAGGESLQVAMTVGAVAHGEEDGAGTVRGSNPEELIRYGDVALHRAKEESAAGFHLFVGDEDVEGAARIRLEQQLRRALDEGQVVPRYQPIVRLPGGSVAGVEVLARWRHPERGLLAPGEFLPVAEELGLVGRLGEVIARRALGEVADWPAGPGGKPFYLSLNASAQQFEGTGLAGSLTSWLEEASFPADRLVLEVTESSAVRATARIGELRELGVRIHVDDFGTGYSTFTYLRDLEVDGLKIDRTFVSRLAERGPDAALAETMVALGRQLGLTVVAEGIEEEAQRDLLVEMECPLGQGFLFGRPVDAAALRRRLGDR